MQSKENKMLYYVCTMTSSLMPDAHGLVQMQIYRVFFFLVNKELCVRCFSAKLVNVRLTVNRQTLIIHDPGELCTILKPI